MTKRRAVHRLWYPNAKDGQESRSVRPLAKASPLVDARGVKIEWLETTKHFTPNELQMLARWLFSLSHEAKEIASQGLVDEDHGYDVVEGKVVPSPGR